VQQTSVITHLNALLAARVTMNDVRKFHRERQSAPRRTSSRARSTCSSSRWRAPKVQEIAPRSAGCASCRWMCPRLRSTHEEDPPEYYFSTVKSAPHIAGIDKPTKVQTIDFIIGSNPREGRCRARLHQGLSTNKKALSRPSELQRLRSLAFGQVQPRLAYHPAAEKYWKETGLR